MEQYTIKEAYPFESDCNEVEISSEGLIYSEIGNSHYGVQVSNLKNQKAILSKCLQVADLIREIDKLNKV